MAFGLGSVTIDLDSFKMGLDRLLSDQDGRFEQWKKELRRKVYISVCIGTVGFGCPIAAAIVETKIKKGKGLYRSPQKLH